MTTEAIQADIVEREDQLSRARQCGETSDRIEMRVREIDLLRDLLAERQSRERAEQSNEANWKLYLDMHAKWEAATKEVAEAAELNSEMKRLFDQAMDRAEQAEQRLAEQGDETPIDEAWLRSIADSHSPDGHPAGQSFNFRGRDDTRLVVHLHIGVDGNRLWTAEVWQDSDCVTLYGLQTRADVLRLLSALNISTAAAAKEGA